MEEIHRAASEAAALKEEIMKEEAAARTVLDQRNLAKEQLQAQKQQLLRQHDEEMRRMKEYFDMLESAVDEYHKNLYQAMNSS
jgi:hypothetical protein